MTFTFSDESSVCVTMEGYTHDLLSHVGVKGKASTPAGAELFQIDPTSPELSSAEREEFHSVTAKLLYLSKRTRPELLPLVAFLTSRVQRATVQDQAKLDRGLKYLNSEPEIGLVFRDEGDIQVFGHTDASFAVHPEAQSHTGSTITMGGGSLFAKSTRQKIVTKSSTESELVGLSDSVPQIIWTRDFLTAQGYPVRAATVYQDNKSTICLAEKGRSTSERTRHINIRYFFIKDRIASGEVKVEYLPTERMVADILTKPLQGELFRRLRDALLTGADPAPSST